VLESELLAALKTNTPPNDSAALCVVVHDTAGALVGGITGTTAYGWLLVKILWGTATQRGQGLGARIMAAAEDAGRARGCYGAWLDTSSRRAEAFYRRLGYGDFGVLENKGGEQPAGHRRVFLCKRFT
jgi:GNAT superfamily N-acetyltransferase